MTRRLIGDGMPPAGMEGAPTRPLRFGVFDWVDDAGRPVAQLYDERIALAKAADAAGFHCYHVAEHHCTPLGLAPSPNVLLAALARETHGIRLGPLVLPLPLYEPLRLINEIAMLDHLSHGRLEVGVGKGVSPYELGYHGVDAAAAEDIFTETLDTLLAAWGAERLTAGGARTRRYDDVPLPLRPLQRPHPPLWCPTASPDKAEWAARHGMNVMGLGPAERFAASATRCRGAWTAGEDAEMIVGMMRKVVVAPSDEEAIAIARAAHPRFAASFMALWDAHGNPRPRAMVDFDAAVEHGTLVAGTAASVHAELARQAQAADLNYFALAFGWGELTLEQSLRSLRLFADEPLPVAQTSRSTQDATPAAAEPVGA